MLITPYPYLEAACKVPEYSKRAREDECNMNSGMYPTLSSVAVDDTWSQRSVWTGVLEELSTIEQLST